MVLAAPSELSLLSALFIINPLMGEVKAPGGCALARAPVRHGVEERVRDGGGRALESEETQPMSCFFSGLPGGITELPVQWLLV